MMYVFSEVYFGFMLNLHVLSISISTSIYTHILFKNRKCMQHVCMSYVLEIDASPCLCLCSCHVSPCFLDSNSWFSTNSNEINDRRKRSVYVNNSVPFSHLIHFLSWLSEIKVLEADMLDMPFGDECFDVVVEKGTMVTTQLAFLF